VDARSAVLSIRLLAVFLQPNEIPGRPAEPFTVHVEAGRELNASTESIAELLTQVKAGIGKRKSWILLSDSPDEAEVFVEVLSHRVRQEHRTALAIRRGSRDQLQAVDLVDENYFSERHYLRARVRAIGLTREIVGHDGKEKGASLKRASSQLAEELEEFLKANYQELLEKRRRFAAAGLDLPAAPAPAASPPELPSVAVDPVFQRYLSSVELYRKGDFLSAANAVSLLTPRELYDLGTLFLAGDMSDSEWKAAALLHTESVVSVPRGAAMNRLELARRAAQHLELARRYTQAISDVSSRSRFQKRWYLVVGYYYLASRQTTGAMTLLSSGLQLFPGDPDLLYALASFYAGSGALRGDRDALADAERIYGALGEPATVPFDIDLRLAHVLAELGRLDEAEQRLRRAGLDGTGEAALAARMIEGAIAQKREQWRTARAAFEKAWKLDPTCQACVVALAFACEHTGDREAAAGFVAEWLASGPRDGHDGWWRFLLGPTGHFEELLGEMRAEVLR
jgi:tetratricopeptide (TPR) repeat protein